MSLARGFGVLTVVALCSLPTSAAAHGGPWRAQDVLVRDADHIVLRSNVWGWISTSDGGATWQWTCSEVVGVASASTEYRSTALLPSGDLFVAGMSDGLHVRRSSVCEWTAHARFSTPGACDAERACNVLSVEAVPGEPEGLVVVTSTGTDSPEVCGSVRTVLWESEDAGRTWSELSAELPECFAARDVALSPSDPDRIYVSGVTLDDPGVRTLAASRDAGASWTTTDLSTPDAPSVALRLHGVHPKRADVVYAWLDQVAGPGETLGDAVLLSTDGGSSLDVIVESSDDLPGFALSPDGTKTAIAGPAEGLLIGQSAALEVDGRNALRQTLADATWGLAWHDDGLYVGGDDLRPAAENRFSLGVSRDDGRTFEPVMEICDVELIPCGADTTVGASCPNAYYGASSFEVDFLESSRCLAGHDAHDADAGDEMDSGLDAQTSDPGSSGACTIAAGRPSRGLMALLLVALVARPGRRRFRRRSEAMRSTHQRVHRSSQVVEFSDGAFDVGWIGRLDLLKERAPAVRR